MKKFNAVLLALLLILQSVNVFAASDFDDWQFQINGTDFKTNENVAVSITDKNFYDGAKALEVNCPVKSTERDDSNYIEVKNPLTKNPETGKYTFEMYAKKKKSGTFEGEISIGSVKFTVADMTQTAATAPSGQKNWVKYSHTFDYTQSDNAYLSMKFYCEVAPYAYMDNFSLTKEGDTKNYIVNADMEEFYEEVVEQPYDTTDYLPGNIICSGYAPYEKTNSNGGLDAFPGGACISWKNPKTTELSKISIYDVTDGETLITDSVSVTPSAFIYERCPIDGDDERLFKVVFSYKTKADREYFFSCAPKEKTEVKGGWTTLSSRNGTFNATPMDIYVDPTGGADGSAGLKMTSNLDRNDQILQSDTFVGLQQTLSFSEGKTYAMSMMVKSVNMKNRVMIHMDWVGGLNGIGAGTNLMTDMNGTHDWKKFEFKYTYKTYRTFRLIFDGAADELMFDNFECYEIDDNGDPVGENLFKNGDFEGFTTNDTVTLNKASADAGVGEATLSWDTKSSKFGGVDIYQKVFDNYEYRGTVSQNFKSVTFNTLKQNEEYTFKLVPKNSTRVIGEEKELTVTTKLIDYDITEPILTKNGTAVDSLSGAGEYKITTTAKNNLVEAGIAYEQLVGIFEGDTLVKLYSTKSDVPKKKPAAPYIPCETTFTLPEGNYHAEVFLVKSRQNPTLFTSAEFN